LLAELAGDPGQPGIARATAVALLGAYAGPTPASTLSRALQDPDPLVRMGALGSVEALPVLSRLRLVAPLLRDPIRTIRIDAARALASREVRPAVNSDAGGAFAVALDEYRGAQLANADRAEAHLNLGALDLEEGGLGGAEQEYRTALRLNPWSAPSYANLAELYARQGRDPEGERVLRRGLEAAPADPGLHQELGLLLVREKRLPEALVSLARAAELAPEQAHFGYVYAVALHSAGQADRALAVLKKAHQAHPGDAEVLLALVTMTREKGALSDALGFARELAALLPWDPRARQLLAQLEGQYR
jgi:Flp pilus assembly protein TadD